MTCTEPVLFETLVALWANDLDAETAEGVEAHVFACDRCHAAAERLGFVVDGVRNALPPVISRAHLDRLLAAGTRIVTTVVEAGRDAHARFAPEVDLLIHVLRADLAGAERVDVEMVSPDDSQQMPFEQVPFDAARGEVLIACQRHYEHFPFEPKFRVYATAGGARRRVGDYFVHHVWR